MKYDIKKVYFKWKYLEFLNKHKQKYVKEK